MMTDEQMKYPTGKFTAPVSYTNDDQRRWITVIKELPGRVRQAIMTLNEKQLDTPYRTGGWTLRQVVHHLPDSHMNALIRFKWALTENSPTIKAYQEADWALLPDYRIPVEPSIKMLEGIHQRWVAILESFTEEDWTRAYIHPETGETIPLKKALALYAWHSKHHLAHLTETIKKF